MFGQMHSRRVILPPCPCNNICRCHLPRKGLNPFEKKIIFGVLLVFILIESCLIYHSYKYPYKGPEHIEVNGKMCEIWYHSDCASPMSCGHKVVLMDTCK